MLRTLRLQEFRVLRLQGRGVYGFLDSERGNVKLFGLIY